MRRILYVLIAVACLFTLVACRPKQQSYSSDYEYTAKRETAAPSSTPDLSPSASPKPEYNYLSDISEIDIDSMSEAAKTILRINVGIAIANKEAGEASNVEVSLGGLDRINLSDLSLEKLEWIKAYIEDGTTSPEPKATPAFDIDVYTEQFSTEMRVQFCLYEAIQELSRSLEWYVTQNNNPEVSFDTSKQELNYVHYYLDYYADCTASEAQEAVEEYTNTMIEAIQYAFPDVQVDQLAFFWKIPAIDEENLYAARFFCENEGGSIVRGDGSGLIY